MLPGWAKEVLHSNKRFIVWELENTLRKLRYGR
jgi:hypothetical protein